MAEDDKTPQADGPAVRKGQPNVRITREEFAKRVRELFYDPAFESAQAQIDAVVEAAWSGYAAYRKSPRTRLAGQGFADPTHNLPIEGLEARDRIRHTLRRRGDAT